MIIRRKWNRRDFLKTASAATLGALAAGAPRQILAADSKPSAHSGCSHCIVDGRRHGAHRNIRSQALPFHFPKHGRFGHVEQFRKSIRLSDNIKFSQRAWKKIASVMDRGTLVRPTTAGDLGFILHTRHQYNATLAMRRLRQSPARTLGRSLRERLAQRSCRARLLLHRAKLRSAGKRGIEGLPHAGFLAANTVRSSSPIRPMRSRASSAGKG